jgi:hypothetical protein
LSDANPSPYDDVRYLIGMSGRYVVDPDQDRHHVRVRVEHVGLPAGFKVHHLVAGVGGVQPGHGSVGAPEAPVARDSQRVAASGRILVARSPEVGDRIAGDITVLPGRRVIVTYVFLTFPW